MQRVEVLVRIFSAKSTEHDPSFVSFAVAIRIFKKKQISTLGHIDAAVAGLQAGRYEEVLSEEGNFIGASLPGSVLEDNNFIGGRLAGFDLGVDRRAGDPQPSAGVKIHMDRFIEQRILGPKRDFEALGDLELRVGLGHAV